jgi:hypothetical protein
MKRKKESEKERIPTSKNRNRMIMKNDTQLEQMKRED